MPIGSGLAGQVGLADETYTNEVQQISGTPSTPFTITYDGATTASLATNASSAAVQTALNALPNIGASGVSCTGGSLPTAIIITFSGPLVAGRNLPAVTINTATGVTVATNTAGVGYGDYIAPTIFTEVISAKPQLNMDRLKSNAIRSGNTVQRTDRKYPNKKGASVSVSMEVPTKGFSKWCKTIFGAVPVITTPSNGVLTRLHTYTFGSSANISQSIQTGVPSVPGDASNVKAITSLGCKAETASFKCDLDSFLTLDIDFNAKDETDSQTLGAASYASSYDLFHYLNATVQINGAYVDVTKFQVDVKNSISTDRRFLSENTLQKQQILNGMRELTGSVTVEFDSLTQYDRFASLTMAGALVPIIVTFQGPQIEAVTPTYYQKLVFTMPNCDITGSTPTLDAPDLVSVDIPFDINWDGTTEPLTFAIYTTDTAA